MKCVCGYEYKAQWDEKKKDYVIVIGDEEFIKLDTKATVETGEGYYRSQKDVELYICPKCETVRASVSLF